MREKFSYEVLKDHYEGLVAKAKIVREGEAKLIAAKLSHNRKIYEEIEKVSKVPWYLVAALHSKEASGRMSAYLGNGQPFDKKTTKVPKGRGPFKSFIEGAVDALALKEKKINSLDVSGGWSMGQCLWFAEAYNGWGYMLRGVNSPYVWSGTNQYTKGGYPSDGKFDPNYVITNLGIYPILSVLRGK